MSLRRLGQPFRRKGGHSNESESPLVHAVKERTITRPPVDSFDVEGFDFERSHGIKIWEDNSQDSQESDQDDNALAEDVEITEGGWICRVERFEKHVDSEGRVHYRRPRKENSSPVVDQDVTDAQKPVTLDQGEKDNYVQQSIISYFSHSTKTDSKDLIDPDMYIEIKSPLILEVLRENTSYGQESLRGKKVTFHEPYPLLWHQYHALETYSKNQSKPKDHRAHIRVLLDFLRSCAMPNVPELIELCNPENSIRSISYPSLWFLFTPDTLAISRVRISPTQGCSKLITSGPLLERSIEKADLYTVHSSLTVNKLNMTERSLSFS